MPPLRSWLYGHRSIAVLLTALCATMAYAAESHAQQPTSPPSPAPCLGYSYNTRPVALLAGGVQTVVEVLPGTPAEAGGLQPRDLLVSIAGVPTSSPLPPILVPGDTIDFVVSREGRNVKLVMVVGQREPSPSGDLVCRPVARPASAR